MSDKRVAVTWLKSQAAVIEEKHATPLGLTFSEWVHSVIRKETGMIPKIEARSPELPGQQELPAPVGRGPAGIEVLADEPKVDTLAGIERSTEPFWRQPDLTSDQRNADTRMDENERPGLYEEPRTATQGGGSESAHDGPGTLGDVEIEVQAESKLGLDGIIGEPDFTTPGAGSKVEDHPARVAAAKAFEKKPAKPEDYDDHDEEIDRLMEEAKSSGPAPDPF